jgi:nicotinamidase-related amidase
MQTSILSAGGAFPDLLRGFPAAPERAGVVCRAARAAGVPVVHALVTPGEHFLGWSDNAGIFGVAAARMRRAGTAGLERAHEDLLAELDHHPSDLVFGRHQGLGPFASDELAAVLRNLGVATVVLLGASVNVALTNAVFGAVNAGFRVVVVRDAIAGVPVDYVESVVANTYRLLATIEDAEAVADRLRHRDLRGACEVV